MAFKEYYVLDFSKADQLDVCGFEVDNQEMPGFAISTWDKDNVIFVDMLGSYYGVKGLVLWNDIRKNDHHENIAPHIKHCIEIGLFTKRVFDFKLKEKVEETK